MFCLQLAALADRRGLLGPSALISLLVAPVFRDKLNRQFLLGARNQAFLTEYVSGMATVKSLQMEPHSSRSTAAPGRVPRRRLRHKQVGNTYNVSPTGWNR
jgi:subfamily B ATP-binding cassette protein HlyB/CyaB